MVGIIYIGNINRCPYLKYYTNCMEKKGIEYEIIYWDRSLKIKDGSRKTNESNLHIFNLASKEQRKPYKKIIDFYRFSKFVRGIVKQQNYDKLIILTTMTGIVLFPELLGKYKKKYIFDYRDASYEYIKPFYMILSKIIHNSYFTSISSKGFLNILPKDENYILAHNITNYKTNKERERLQKDKYRIGYIGGLRSSVYMKKLVDIFAEDPRFEFVVHGGGNNLQELREYSKGFSNVSFTGFYSETEKEFLLKEIDIICYNYPESFNHNIALANKYYDGLIEGIPLLGNIKTYSGKLIESNSIGISLDFNDLNYKEKLYNYIKNIDYKIFDKNCKTLLDEIKLDVNLYVRKIEEFLMCPMG